MTKETKVTMEATLRRAVAMVVLGAAAGLAGAAEGPDVAAMTAEARQVGLPFLRQLVTTLQAEVQARGPEGAVTVCRDLAPRLAGEVSQASGWRVTRIGTRTRNALLGGPDAWEQTVLASFAKRQAAGEKLDAMEQAEVVEEPSGRAFRYMKAIGLQPACVACHGGADEVSAGVRAQLQQLYPHDRATGYAPGQLRGALSIRRPLRD